MPPYAPRPDHTISDDATLRSLYPPTHDIAIDKALDRLDAHARAYIDRAPFLCIGTQSPDGRADVSPRGDPKGFVKVLDARTLAIPDRPGNNRLDTLSNIVGNPTVGLLFIVPGFDDTLRVNGSATLVTDPDLLATMAVNDRVPKLAIVVRVEEVFLHCAKAFRRSKLWDQSRHEDRTALPSLVNMILDQTTGAPTDPDEIGRNDAELEEEYRRTMY
jgi:hypothetical protein